MLSGARRLRTHARMRVDPLTLAAGVATDAVKSLADMTLKDLYTSIRTTSKDVTATKLLKPIETESERLRKSVFIDRTSVNAKLAEILSDSNFVMLSAGSATGKTTTMGRFLSRPFVSPSTKEIQVPAVCHLKLRTASTQTKAATAFRDALGLKDESLDLEKLFRLTESALTSISDDNPSIYPVVWVEDIHACPPNLAAEISTELLNMGHKVVHTVSEDSGFNMLMNLSGHAARLRHVPFPTITEEEIFAAITSPTIEVKREVVAVKHNDYDWEDKIIEIRQEAVCEEDVARYILSKLGNNLAQIDTCLGKVALRNGVRTVLNRMGMAEVEKAIENITKSEAVKLASVTTPTAAEIHGKDDLKMGKDLVRAARLLFDALVEADGKPVDFTKVLDDNLANYVGKIVDLNFIRYVDPVDPGDFVLIKRQSLIDGWKKAKATNSRVVAPL